MFMLCPKKAASAMRRASCGRTRKKSVVRMSSVSSQPPKYPAKSPIPAPTIMDTAVAAIPTIREMCAPRRNSRKRSRPSSSVPNQCAADGPLSIATDDEAVTLALNGKTKGPTTAIKTTRNNRAKPAASEPVGVKLVPDEANRALLAATRR